MYLLENIDDKQMAKIAEWFTQILACLDNQTLVKLCCLIVSNCPISLKKDWEYLETLEHWVEKRLVKFQPH